ncbi:alpha/beta hydrolase family protein [Kineococcus terrestris]|uniref:alpha/beta hydrolase family protein n=1 Tax=Kineococcus terrestris TaxID=2044856 RepID=UPI0034DB2166
MHGARTDRDDRPAATATPGATGGPAVEVPGVAPVGVATTDDVETSGDPLARWAAETDAEPVTVVSSVDGAEQDVLWQPPAGEGAPLLVAVHSWSSDWTQENGIPYAQWVQRAGWGFVHPDFRGVNERPEATGSTPTTSDVVDAVDFAVAEGGVDPGRVYVVGSSGGGTTALLLAGRHPDRFAGAVSWVPIDDLTRWYAYDRDERPEEDYADQIAASCGGDPTAGGGAAASCAGRSPASVLAAAREAAVPVYLGVGIRDETVPPLEGLEAFDALADEEDRVGADALAAAADGELLPEVAGRQEADARFGEGDPPVLATLASAAVTAVVFDDGHAVVHDPGLRWLLELDAAR